MLRAEVLGVLAVAFLALALVGAGVAGALAASWLKNLPDASKPGAFDVAQATTIYSADGKVLARLYLENRRIVTYEEMSPWALKGIVATEDERFYQHHGVDYVGLVRAVIVNLTQGFGEEGASTISQQYIRNTILLDERTTMTLARKLREAVLATELEKRYSKKQILTMYLNGIYFGEGAYGLEAASRVYFARHANELTLAQAALLVGLPQQPGRLDPYQHLDRAIERRNVVLERMLKNRYITQTQYKTALEEPVVLERAKDPENGIYAAPFFVAHVKKLLQSQFSQGTVFSGGLKVYTTLDTRLQGYAESATKHGVPKGPEVALVSIDPRNGFVKAIVGGRDYNKNKFNLATQSHRQAGSAFKMFTLVTALQQGVSPSYRVDSSSPAKIPSRPPWIVDNSEGSGKGSMSLAAATAASVNTVFARVAWGVGAKNIVKTAKAMGIVTPLSAFPSITLGAQNVTVLEMASAYGTLATNGKHFDPVFITKVVDKDGKVLLDVKPKGKQVLKPSIAYAATQVLRGVISGGTATRARIGRPAAGKTGTSQRNRDVWFVGYTPQLVTAIWVGHKTERTIIVRGARAFGGTVCAPIWHDYMSKALKGEPILNFKHQKAPRYGFKKINIPHGKEETKTVVPTPPDSGGGTTPPDGGGGGGGTTETPTP